MSMLQEFKEFAMKGNVVDLAVGVVIGGAFGKIVDSLVNDIIMPLVGFVTGGVDFTNKFIQLSGAPAATYEAAKKAGATLGYGSFFTAIVMFLIIAMVLFMVVKAMNRMKKEQAATPEAAPADIQLLTEIRDLLKR